MRCCSRSFFSALQNPIHFPVFFPFPTFTSTLCDSCLHCANVRSLSLLLTGFGMVSNDLKFGISEDFLYDSLLAKVLADSIIHMQGSYEDVSFISSSYSACHFLCQQLSILSQNSFPVSCHAGTCSLKACRNGKRTWLAKNALK